MRLTWSTILGQKVAVISSTPTFNLLYQPVLIAVCFVQYCSLKEMLCSIDGEQIQQLVKESQVHYCFWLPQAWLIHFCSCLTSPATIKMYSMDVTKSAPASLHALPQGLVLFTNYCSRNLSPQSLLGKNILLRMHCSSVSIFYNPPAEMSHKMKIKYESNQYQSVFLCLMKSNYHSHIQKRVWFLLPRKHAVVVYVSIHRQTCLGYKNGFSIPGEKTNETMFMYIWLQLVGVNVCAFPYRLCLWKMLLRLLWNLKLVHILYEGFLCL